MDNWTLADRMVPLELHLSIDYVPWDGDYGWDQQTIIEELRAAFERKFRPSGAPEDIKLADVEVL